MAYIDGGDLRDWIRISESVTDQDPKLQACADAACSSVDAYCGRSFDLAAGGAPTERIYRLGRTGTIDVDDLAAVDGITVETAGRDRTTWTELDPAAFWIGPDGVDSKRIPEPWTELNLIETRLVGCSAMWARVTTNAWGWPGEAFHPSVVQASKLIGHWLFKRAGSPFGIVGPEMLGRISRQGDPDAANLLDPLCRVDRTVGIA